MKEHIKQFLYLLDRPAKKAIPLILFNFLLSSVLDVIGVALIGVFLGLITNPHLLSNRIPFIGSWLSNLSNNKILIISGLLIISAFATKAFLVLKIQKQLIFFCQMLAVRLKTRLMTTFQYAPYIYHLQKNSDYLISRIQGNIDSYVNNVLMAILYLVSNSLITFFILSFLLIMHPYSTIILFGAFILLGVGYDYFAKKKLVQMGKRLAITNAEITKSVREGLHGLVEARVLGKENYFIEKLNRYSLEHAASYGVLVTGQLLPRFLIENMIAIFIVLVCMVGLTTGYNSAHIVAMVGIFAAASARLLPTFTQIITSINQIRGYFHHMGLVYSELIEVDELKRNSFQTNLLLSTDSKLLFSKVDIENASYKYPQSNNFALKNVDLTILKGQSIGLIGHSGAGKSTLVNLILGFVEPQSGQLLIDGKSIQCLRRWLNNFAYIPQSIFLLDDTLRHNIAFGTNDEDIDDNRLFSAIKMAQLNEVVENLPEGVNTFIGENGIRLSGGQRQRVALARAFYYERDIIIMDEATSSLDNETEKEIINTIKRLKGEKTLIVIAHRLTTVEHCDILYRIEKGIIISAGSFKEVIGLVAT